MSEIVFATNNQNKIKEVMALLPPHFRIKTLNDINCTEELPETQNTIEGNSLQKAMYVFEKYGCACFAEDSGLEVFALKGEPGVHSAYYSGSRDAEANSRLLLHKLMHVDNREAQFKTVFTFVTYGIKEQFTGIVTGKIISEPRGTGGFGYDPIFVANGFEQTFAEMLPQEKIAISHRSKAFKKLTAYLKNYF